MKNVKGENSQQVEFMFKKKFKMEKHLENKKMKKKKNQK